MVQWRQNVLWKERINTMPHRSWHRLYDNLGAELLCRLVGLSKKDLEDFLDDKIEVPVLIDDRLDFLVKLYRCLAGSYSRQSLRDWFDAPRALLGLHTPKNVLSGFWRPEEYRPLQVLEVARQLADSRPPAFE